jgi:hypothetical protein
LIAAVALTAVTTIVLPSAVCAQQSDERRQCFASEGVTPEPKLENSTLLISPAGRPLKHGFAAL